MQDLTRSGFDLTADEHLQAEELIDELQDRIITLGTRKDSSLKTTNRPSSYQPLIHTVKLGDEVIVVKVRKSEVRVSHQGKQVLAITGMNLDGINFAGLTKALVGLQRYMILDDLANI